MTSDTKLPAAGSARAASRPAPSASAAWACPGPTAPAERDDDRSIAVIRRALELGVTLIDTADMYGPFTNEELVGRALGGRRERGGAGHQGRPRRRRPGRPGVAPATAGPEHIRGRDRRLLRRLGTDHVDLYQLHRVDPEVPLEETWGAMAEAVAAGKARAIGLSELTVDELERAHAIHPVASVQSELSLWTRDRLDEVLPWCEANDVAFIPFSPLGRGFLTGRHRRLFDDRRLPRAATPLQREAMAPTWRSSTASARSPTALGATPGAGRARLGARPGRAGDPDPGHRRRSTSRRTRPPRR